LKVLPVNNLNFSLSNAANVYHKCILSVDRKIKSQAQFDVLVGKIKRLEGARDEVANVATPLVQAMFLNDSGPSALDATEIFDKLRVAPDVYFKRGGESWKYGS
jgi:hypothetical protein